LKINFVPVDVTERTKRYFVWNDNGIGGQLIYIAGYRPDTLAHFLGLFLDAQKYVPEVNAEKAICTKVKKSRSIKDFCLMIINIDIEKREIPGFKEVKWADLEIEAF
jgi:hypothetical protein